MAVHLVSIGVYRTVYYHQMCTGRHIISRCVQDSVLFDAVYRTLLSKTTVVNRILHLGSSFVYMTVHNLMSNLYTVVHCPLSADVNRTVHLVLKGRKYVSRSTLIWFGTSMECLIAITICNFCIQVIGLAISNDVAYVVSARRSSSIVSETVVTAELSSWPLLSGCIWQCSCLVSRASFKHVFWLGGGLGVIFLQAKCFQWEM